MWVYFSTSLRMKSTANPWSSGAAAPIDFDFDSFFNNIASSSTGMGTGLDSGMDFTSPAFLDEVPTPTSSSDQTASPVLSLKQDVSPEASGVEASGSGTTFAATPTGGGGGPTKASRKRKSEVAIESDTPATPLDTPPLTSITSKTTAGGNKSKRRRDK